MQTDFIRAFLPAWGQDRYVTRKTATVLFFYDVCSNIGTYHKICVQAAFGLGDFELSSGRGAVCGTVWAVLLVCCGLHMYANRFHCFLLIVPSQG